MPIAFYCDKHLLCTGRSTLAKSHYSFKKRKKEMARKLKQEQKRQRRLEKAKPSINEDPDTDPDTLDDET
jgi:hypothetical protein